MREVRDLSAGIKDAMAAIRAASIAAKAALSDEVSRTVVNVEKIKSFTAELKADNHEMEALLGESGSNFPPSETSSESSTLEQPKLEPARLDRNGVTTNPEANQ